LADHVLFKMVRYVLLRPLRPELDVSWSNILCPTFLFTSIVLLYISLKKFIGIFLLFFRVFSHKTDKSEAKDP
jgi:membrane-bound metal-dependent hydrolase YbcI (DUF457 family)